MIAMLFLIIRAEASQPRVGPFIAEAGPSEAIEDAYSAAVARFLGKQEEPWWRRRASDDALALAIDHLGLTTVGTACEAVQSRVLEGSRFMWLRLSPRARRPLLGALRCEPAPGKPFTVRRLRESVRWASEMPR